MRDWWNQGVHDKSLITYCFLVRCSIPACFWGLALVSSWQANIHEMMRRIPTIATADNKDNHGDGDDKEGIITYFDTIDAKLTMYETLLHEAPMLFPEQIGVVLDILSFL
jgi:hypothetical protein